MRHLLVTASLLVAAGSASGFAFHPDSEAGIRARFASLARSDGWGWKEATLYRSFTGHFVAEATREVQGKVYRFEVSRFDEGSCVVRVYLPKQEKPFITFHYAMPFGMLVNEQQQPVPRLITDLDRHSFAFMKVWRDSQVRVKGLLSDGWDLSKYNRKPMP